jgi:hypothetical protein
MVQDPPLGVVHTPSVYALTAHNSPTAAPWALHACCGAMLRARWLAHVHVRVCACVRVCVCALCSYAAQLIVHRVTDFVKAFEWITYPVHKGGRSQVAAKRGGRGGRGQHSKRRKSA